MMVFRVNKVKSLEIETDKNNIDDTNKSISDSDDEQDFFCYIRESKLLPPELWPHQSPLFVCASHRAKNVKYELPESIDGSPTFLPLDGTVVTFSSNLFSGKIVSRVRDIPDSLTRTESSCKPKCSSDEYFKGRSRQFQWTVQGTFRKRTRFDHVVTGQDFGRPFRNTPSATIVKRALNILRNKLPETFSCDLFAQKPHFEHPLLAGCNKFRVDSLKNLPPNLIYGEGDLGDIIEDTTLLGPNVPKSPEARKKYFSKHENLKNHYFECDKIYTFDFYANFFSPSRHKLEITPFFSVDLIPYFNGFPLFMAMAKDKETGEYLWATEMWHRQLVEYKICKPGIITRILCTGGTKT